MWWDGPGQQPSTHRAICSLPFKHLKKTHFLSHSRFNFTPDTFLSRFTISTPHPVTAGYTQAHQWWSRWHRRLESVHSYFFLLLCSFFPPLLLPSYCFLCSSVGSSMGHSPYNMLQCMLIHELQLLNGSICSVRVLHRLQSFPEVLALAWAYPQATVSSGKYLLQCESSTDHSSFRGVTSSTVECLLLLWTFSLCCSLVQSPLVFYAFF